MWYHRALKLSHVHTLGQTKDLSIPCDSESWNEPLARELKSICMRQHENLEGGQVDTLRIQKQIKAVSIFHYQCKYWAWADNHWDWGRKDLFCFLKLTMKSRLVLNLQSFSLSFPGAKIINKITTLIYITHHTGLWRNSCIIKWFIQDLLSPSPISRLWVMWTMFPSRLRASCWCWAYLTMKTRNSTN